MHIHDGKNNWFQGVQPGFTNKAWRQVCKEGMSLLSSGIWLHVWACVCVCVQCVSIFLTPASQPAIPQGEQIKEGKNPRLHRFEPGKGCGEGARVMLHVPPSAEERWSAAADLTPRVNGSGAMPHLHWEGEGLGLWGQNDSQSQSQAVRQSGI